MSEMLDKAAAALDAEGRKMAKLEPKQWESHSEEVKEGVRVLARVAIHALLNPSLDIISIGETKFFDSNNEEVKNGWNTMINEILKR